MDNLNARKQAVLASIEALRGERTGLRAQLTEKTDALAEMLADFSGIVKLLETVWALLPSSVRARLEKYRT